MLKPNRPEIDHHTIKLIIGIIALSLASLTSYFAQTPLTSISASYHESGWSGDIFVGFLFAISALLVAYNGRSSLEMVISKIAAFSALGVAMFPCSCVNHQEIIPYVHYVSAAVMFLILAVFCYSFFKRAHSKSHYQAKLRAYIYALCGITIVLSILILALDFIIGGHISTQFERLTFYSEKVGLIAFGFAWLTASRMLPIITDKKERLSIIPRHKTQHS